MGGCVWEGFLKQFNFQNFQNTVGIVIIDYFWPNHI
jgi:hypothetical protein